MGSISGVVAFDSGFDALDAIRSAGVLDGRQLVVAAGDRVIVVDVIERSSALVITGHAPGFVGPIAVQFLDAVGREVGLGATDEHDDFEVEVDSMPRSLVLAADDVEIVVELSLDVPGV